MKTGISTPLKANASHSIGNSNSDSPLISVITASWNQGKYLRECVTSVIPSSKDAVEHIIVDNCSDDETPDVFNQFEHLRLLVEPDKGQCDAFNKGIAMARGKWILWLNSDDYLTCGSIDTYLSYVKERDDFDVMYGHMILVDENGGRLRTIFQPKWNYNMSRYGVYGLPSTGTLYRASLFRNAPLDVDFHMIMDSEWTLRNGRRLRALRLRKETVAFRISALNKTSANVQHGAVSRRHAAEREVLSSRYPYCNPQFRLSTRARGEFFVLCIRHALRLQVKVDKGCSLLASIFMSLIQERPSPSISSQET